MPSHVAPDGGTPRRFPWHTGQLFALIVVVLLVMAPSPSSASENANSQPIVGGSNSGPGEWPWQVALVFTGPGSDYQNQFCGGSIVSSSWILTAAHCMFDEFGELTTDDFVVIADRTNLLDGDGETLAPIAIFIHQDYDNDLEGGTDVALIKLSTPTSGTPITLARDPNAPYLAPGQTATVTGWGSIAAYEPEDEDPPADFPPALRKVEVPFRSGEACADWYGQIHDEAVMLCAGGTDEGGAGSCQGDSGGPLVVFDGASQSWMLAGITSFGAGCAAAGVPSVYTEVAGVLLFIDMHTGPLYADMTPQAFFPLLTRD